MMFIDMAEPSQIIEIAEPPFSNLNAEVEIVPVISGDDLRKGIGKVAKHLHHSVALAPPGVVAQY